MEIAEVNGAQAQEPWHNLVLDTCDPFLTFLSGFIQNFTHRVRSAFVHNLNISQEIAIFPVGSLQALMFKGVTWAGAHFQYFPHHHTLLLILIFPFFCHKHL